MLNESDEEKDGSYRPSDDPAQPDSPAKPKSRAKSAPVSLTPPSQKGVKRRISSGGIVGKTPGQAMQAAGLLDADRKSKKRKVGDVLKMSGGNISSSSSSSSSDQKDDDDVSKNMMRRQDKVKGADSGRIKQSRLPACSSGTQPSLKRSQKSVIHGMKLVVAKHKREKSQGKYEDDRSSSMKKLLERDLGYFKEWPWESDCITVAGQDKGQRGQQETTVDNLSETLISDESTLVSFG
jgi:hypothetical protein